MKGYLSLEVSSDGKDSTFSLTLTLSCIGLFQTISTHPHGRHWKSCNKCSVSLTGIPRVFLKFCEFFTEIPAKPFKILQNSGIPQEFESAGFGILRKLLLCFLEILKFLGTQFGVVHRVCVDIFWNSPFRVTVWRLRKRCIFRWRKPVFFFIKTNTVHFSRPLSCPELVTNINEKYLRFSVWSWLSDIHLYFKISSDKCWSKIESCEPAFW